MVDLNQFASAPTTKGKKTGPDITKFNAVIEIADKAGLRLSYDAAKVTAQKLGLLSLSQPTTAVFGLLNLVTRPWTVCRKTGQYDPTALAKFVSPPEGFLTRPIIQSDKVEAFLAEVEKELAKPAPTPATIPPV